MHTGFSKGISMSPERTEQYKKEIRALAEKYKERAEIVESMGYAKYAETLRLISDDYIKEAEHNIREHQLEQEVQRRENDEN